MEFLDISPILYYSFHRGMPFLAVSRQERTAGERMQKSAVIEKDGTVDDIGVVQHPVVGDLAQMRCAFRLIRDLIGGGCRVERSWRDDQHACVLARIEIVIEFQLHEPMKA